MKRLFYIRRSDRIAVLSLLFIIILAIIAIYIAGYNEKTTFVVNDYNDSVDMEYTLKHAERKHTNHKDEYYNIEVQERELFPFDPNTADSTQLLRLGLRPWQVRNIYKYRANGGIYRKPSDFARLYGLTAKDYKTLEPYINISSEYQPAATLYKDEREERTVYNEKLKPGDNIDLNSSDTTELKKVPGIGSAYAKAIINYRERLGGYANINQLMEISGFPETALPYFTIDTAPLRKLNINKLSLSQLRSHPYINFYQAKSIIDYRRLRGNITSLHDLSLLKEFTKEDIDRLEPYVELP